MKNSRSDKNQRYRLSASVPGASVREARRRGWKGSVKDRAYGFLISLKT